MKPVGSLLTYDRKGLHANGFSIDPSVKTNVALVSHAHGDHAHSGHQVVYATRGTWSLMQERYGDSLRSEFHEVTFGVPFFIGQVKITFFPAGHILGSAQLLLEYEGERYLYTGDFKVQQDPTCEPFHPVKCDYLITETTFAHPDFSHPSPEDELRQLCLESLQLVIGAYAVGKAQRITRLLHQVAPDRKLFIHPLISGYHKVYEAAGIHLGDWLPYSRQEFLKDSANILILPPTVFTRYDRHPAALRIFATGWKRSYYRCDRVLSISDHADWNDLINVIAESEAKKVFTLHGDGSLLKEHLRGAEVQIELLDSPR